MPSIGGTVAIEWFAKSHEVYGSVLGDKAGSDDAHYLNLTKTAGEGSVVAHLYCGGCASCKQRQHATHARIIRVVWCVPSSNADTHPIDDVPPQLLLPAIASNTDLLGLDILSE